MLYLDANNEYGWAMSQPLPYKDLGFGSDTAIEEILETSDDNEKGYIVEVDISFPKSFTISLKSFHPVQRF